MEGIVSLLAAVPLLAGVPEEAISALANAAELRRGERCVTD